MMKKALLVFGITMASAPSYGWEMPPIPSLEDQIKDANEIKFKAVVREVEQNDYFAGVNTVLTSPNGVVYQVDRRNEPMRRTPGNPPPRLETLTSLLGSLDVTARGNIHINVQREFYPDGTLKSEDWSIDVGGSWQAASGKGEADDKNHK